MLPVGANPPAVHRLLPTLELGALAPAFGQLQDREPPGANERHMVLRGAQQGLVHLEQWWVYAQQRLRRETGVSQCQRGVCAGWGCLSVSQCWVGVPTSQTTSSSHLPTHAPLRTSKPPHSTSQPHSQPQGPTLQPHSPSSHPTDPSIPFPP